MYKKCRTEQSAKRQLTIINELLLLMKSVPYKEITVSRLREQSHIPRKTFYRYFDSKEDVLYAMIDSYLMNPEQLLAPCYEDIFSLKKDLERIFQYWKKEHVLLDVLEKNGLSEFLSARAIVMNMDKDRDEIRKFLPSECIERMSGTVFVISGIYSIVINWHHAGYKQSVEKIAEITLELLIKPLIQTDKETL